MRNIISKSDFLEDDTSSVVMCHLLYIMNQTQKSYSKTKQLFVVKNKIT